MLYTITFNPAVDLVLKTDTITLGGLNRVASDDYVAGGKGINISVLLKRLGHENIATGFIGGFTGDFIVSELEKEGVKTAFVKHGGTTRVNVKIKADVETEINAQGPVIDADQFDELLTYLQNHLQAGDVVFLAGNAASGMDARHYQAISALCLQLEVKLALDSNKDLLVASLVNHPYLIKPNNHELSEIFQAEVSSIQEIVARARELQQMGARHVIVSLGKEGAVLVSETGEVYQASVPRGVVVNSVGAGDSMVAGFMAKMLETNDLGQSLRYGSACGSATAFSVGIAQRSLVEQLYKQITIREIGESV